MSQNFLKLGKNNIWQNTSAKRLFSLLDDVFKSMDQFSLNYPLALKSSRCVVSTHRTMSPDQRLWTSCTSGCFIIVCLSHHSKQHLNIYKAVTMQQGHTPLTQLHWRSQPSAASVFQTIISFFSFVPVSLNVYIHTHTHTYMGTYIYKYKVYVNSVSVSAHLTNLIFGIL